MADFDDRPNPAPNVPIHRWQGIRRDYTEADVRRLRGSVRLDYTLAELGARRLWGLLQSEDAVHAAGLDGDEQARAHVGAGVPALWVGSAPSAEAGLPVATLVRRVNRALTRADEIECAAGRRGRCWHAPVVADAGDDVVEPFQAFERMKALIEAGAAGVHFTDFDPSADHFARTLKAARLAADVLDVPTLLIARVESGDPDEAIARALACAPYADLLWWDGATADPDRARLFADAIHARYPGKILACGGSLPDSAATDDRGRGDALARLGYRFRFVPAVDRSPRREPVPDYSEAVRRILSDGGSLPAPC